MLPGVLALLAACSPQQWISRNMADALASQGAGDETDLELLRDAAPFQLKLSEAVLRQNPAHGPLAESVAAGFTQYTYAFVAFEAERLESRDARAADRLRQRAARLYARAFRHARTALEQQQPGLFARLATPGAELALSPTQVGLAYWAAAAWVGWISLSKDEPEVVADLPAAARLLRLAWQVDPQWGNGALTGLLASFEIARPGGDARQAAAWFDQALRQSDGQSVGAWLAKA
ncbi:MAG: hypothetical protein RIR00_1653, partial [Pseudomonadota bacterium]